MVMPADRTPQLVEERFCLVAEVARLRENRLPRIFANSATLS